MCLSSRCQALGLLEDAFERNGRIFYDAYQYRGVVKDAIIDNMAHLTKGRGTENNCATWIEGTLDR